MIDRLNRRLFTTVSTILPILLAGQAAAFEIGGFDSDRGNLGSLVSGTGHASPEDLRLAVQAAFPDLILSGAPELTAEYLSGVQLLLLTSWWTSGTGVTPLSASEQTVLYDFVVGGGSAMIFMDNHDLSDASHESLLDPFGLDTEGKIDQLGLTCTILAPAACPATMGPYGTLTSYQVDVPGWFDALGPHALALDQMPTGETSLAYIDFGDLGPGSGAVLLCSDSSHLMGLYLHQETIDLVCNMIAACKDQLTGVPDVPSGIAWSVVKSWYLGE